MDNKLSTKLKNQVVQDNAFLVEQVTNAWLALLKDAPFASDSPTYESDLKWWSNYFSTTPFIVVCEVMKAFGDALTQSLHRDPERVKHSYLSWIGRLRIIGGVYIHVVKRIQDWQNLDDIERGIAAHELRYLFSFFKFGVKSEYVDGSLQAVALGNWKSNEERLSKVRLNGYLTRVLRTVYVALFPKFLDETVLGMHGSGSVSDKGIRTLFDKLSLDPVIPESVMNLYFRVPDHRKNKVSVAKNWVMLHCWPHSAQLYETWNKGIQGTAPPARNKSKVKTRNMYVPKDVFKVRGVGCEDLVLMFFQQAVALMFSKTFENTHIRNYINLHDQKRNGDHALIASLDGKSVTVDNKDASDNILARLAKAILPGNIWKHVNATRSSNALLIDGSTVQMQKLSPMGSAVTFPVQSSIFLALSVLSYMLHHVWYVEQQTGIGTLHAMEGKFDLAYALTAIEKLDPAMMEAWLKDHVHSDYHSRSTSKYMCPNIYGDDVIIDVRTYEIFVTLCEAVGFVINITKTHGNESAFRESCGVEAYKGYDVTALYWKCPSGKQRNISLLKSYIGLANRSHLYAYKSLRSHALNQILYKEYGPGLSYQGVTSVRFTNNFEDSSCIWTNNANPNWHLPVRVFDPSKDYSTDVKYRRALKLLESGKDVTKKLLSETSYILYQRTETRGFSVVIRKDESLENDDYRYLLKVRKQTPLWLRLKEREDPVYFDFQKDQNFGSKSLKEFAKPSDFVIDYGWAP